MEFFTNLFPKLRDKSAKARNYEDHGYIVIIYRSSNQSVNDRTDPHSLYKNFSVKKSILLRAEQKQGHATNLGKKSRPQGEAGTRAAAHFASCTSVSMRIHRNFALLNYADLLWWHINPLYNINVYKNFTTGEKIQLKFYLFP